MNQRVRVGGMVVVGSPFVEMVRDIVTTGVGCCVLEIDYNVAVVRRSVRRGRVQLEQVAVLCVVVYSQC